MGAAVPWAVRTSSLMTGRNAVESLRAPFRCQCPDLDHTQGRFSDAAKSRAVTLLAVMDGVKSGI